MGHMHQWDRWSGFHGTGGPGEPTEPASRVPRGRRPQKRLLEVCVDLEWVQPQRFGLGINIKGSSLKCDT